MFSKKESYSLEKVNLVKIPNLRQCNTKTCTDSCALTETKLQQTDPVIFRPFLGLFYLFLHATFNQFASVILKTLPYINPCQHSLVRHSGIFVAVLPIGAYHTHQIFGKRKDRFLLFIRALFGATGFYFQFMAYSYLPLAEASVILSTFPLVTALMARIILKEAYGLVESICLVMTICGVLLTLKLPVLIFDRNSLHFDFTYIVGLGAATGNVLCHALGCVYIRKLKEIHFSVMMLYLGAIGMIENTVINSIFIAFVPPKCGWDQILCILLGATCFISNYFMTIGVQVEPAGLVAIQKSSFDILIIVIFQIIFFNLYPDVYVISGACLVLASLIIVGTKNWILTMPNTCKIEGFCIGFNKN